MKKRQSSKSRSRRARNSEPAPGAAGNARVEGSIACCRANMAATRGLEHDGNVWTCPNSHCGRKWVYVEDEAEGGSWHRLEESGRIPVTMEEIQELALARRAMISASGRVMPAAVALNMSVRTVLLMGFRPYVKGRQ